MKKSETKRYLIGKYKDLNIEIITWDSSTAEVELSCGCIFTHEIDHAEMKGGLANLNNALDGKVKQIREQKLFQAKRFESILIDKNIRAVQSPRILLLGLGDPEKWDAAYLEKAVHIVFQTGSQLGVESIAFAPSLLDSGLSVAENVNLIMLKALLDSYDTQKELEKLGLVRTTSVKNWFFDAGGHQFTEKAKSYADEFKKITVDRNSS